MEKYLQKAYVNVFSDEHYEDFLAAVGVNKFCRFIAKQSRATTILSKKEENLFELRILTCFGTVKQTFSPGQEKEVRYLDGRKFRNTFVFDDNRLIEKQIEKGREVTIIREFHENEMLGTIIVGNIKSKQRSIFEGGKVNL